MLNISYEISMNLILISLLLDIVDMYLVDNRMQIVVYQPVLYQRMLDSQILVMVE